MANIFDGIKQMDEESLRYLIASLETITVTNITKEMGQKAKRGAVKVTNKIASLFNSKQFEEPVVIPLDERIAAKKRELDSLPKNELNHRIRNALIGKIKATGRSVESNASDDEISVEVISLAAKNYKDISEGLTPAQKADAVYERYTEKLKSQIQERLKKQTPEQRKQAERAVQDAIDKMPEKEQEELRQALKINNLTGETVMKMLTTAVGATAILGALGASGMGAFIAITTILHAVFTTAFSITLPFSMYTSAASFLAFITGPAGWLALAGLEGWMIFNSSNKLIYSLCEQVVWNSVRAYGHKFTPKDEELPSWLSNAKAREEANEESIKYLELLKEYEILKKNDEELRAVVAEKEHLISTYVNEMNELNKKIKGIEQRAKREESEKRELERRYSAAREKFDKVTREMDKMHKEYADLSELEKMRYEEIKAETEEAKAELDEKSREINELCSLLETSEKEAEEKKQSVEILKNNNEELQRKIKELVDTLAKVRDEVALKTEKKKKDLQDRWEVAFPKFDFAPDVFSYVAKNFEFNEYGSIEKVLVEMHGASDPMALAGNRGKMADGRAHIGFKTPSGTPGRIFYLLIKDKSSNKRISITDIVKHNDSRYGK